MTRMSKTLGLLALAFCLSACTHKKSDGNKADGFERSAPTGKPAGQFVGAAGDINVVSQNMYCSYGQGDVKYVIDPRLQPGMKFEREETWLAKEGIYSGRGHIFYEIQLVDNASSRLKARVDLPQNPGWWYTYLCEAKKSQDGNDQMACDISEYSPLLSDMMSKGSSKKFGRNTELTTHSQYCSFTPGTDTAGSEYKYEIGTFTLKSGKQVAAFRKVETSKGEYDCDGTKGPGTKYSEKIVSKDVPNPEINCDQATTVFNYEVIKNADGKPVMDTQEELYNF